MGSPPDRMSVPSARRLPSLQPERVLSKLHNYIDKFEYVTVVKSKSNAFFSWN